jgi:hypothetical protein
MGVLGKIKNFFVEEVEEDEEDEEEEREQEQEQLARKVEVPKKSFRERFKLREKLEEDEEEDEEEETEKKIELEEQEPNVYIPKNTNFTFEEEEIKPVPEKNVTMEEEEEELPSRSSRIPLVFEDEDLFKEEDEYNEDIPVNEEVEMEEEEEETPPVKEKFKPPLLYQGKKDSNYIDSLKKETYNAPRKEVDSSDRKFRPSPIISPIYGILDKNYKKEEIRTRNDKTHSNKEERTIDSVRQKVYGETKREEKKPEVVEEKPVKSEKKVNLNRDVPTVSDVTIAAADEYYNELGLVYNENYKDVSRNQPTKKREEPKKKNSDDDNLFRVVGLADSMYDKKED